MLPNEPKILPKIHMQQQIFGKAASYIGVVESENQGSLHLHMLLWLQDALPADEMVKEQRILYSNEAFHILKHMCPCSRSNGREFESNSSRV